MSLFARVIRSIMASEPKKVPIPRNGVDYRGKVVLAPMVRSGELPSRLLALHYGADLVWGPETVDRSMIGTTRRFNPDTQTIEWTRKPSQGAKTPPADVKDSIIYRVHPEKEGRKLIFQIGTSNPELAVRAARLVAADVAGIDVNAGCPKPFSTHDGMGAALLRTPDKLCAILEALVGTITPEFEIGVSVKIRLLETAAETEALVRRLVATGITGLTVHCRTTPMRPRERAVRGQLRMVAAVCRGAGVACLMNGDVETRDQALSLVREYGVDGAMIATQAEKNPSCFRSAPSLLPWEEVVEQYLRCAMEVGNKFGNTKFSLTQLVPGKSPAYRRVSACKSYTRVCEALGLEHLADRAREVDASLDIDPDGSGKMGKMANSSALAAGGQMAESRTKPQAKKGLAERGVGAQEEAETGTQLAAQTTEGMAISV
ncbi:dihydrouridine synthase [Hypoxylon rubiginosum]|uniref:Dihydrouridine synthase n=1 Tax=Hypoxylon rubiginosum TaxID=110542 RepID=A0ACB9ZGC6_9PEZI|nr:dihydrouridine synthase [Hypoxylon rubiginosum]